MKMRSAVAPEGPLRLVLVAAAVCGLVIALSGCGDDASDGAPTDEDSAAATTGPGQGATGPPASPPSSSTSEEPPPAGFSAQVGPEGGSLRWAVTTRAGDEVRLDIPPGALDSEIEITIDALSPNSAPQTPQGFRFFSRLYIFGPPGTNFAEPIRVWVPFDGPAEDRDLYWSAPPDEGVRFDPLGATLADGSAEGEVSHFSIAFVGEPCEPECSGVTCGGDGCGGSCGNCATGEQCERGTCVATTRCSADSQCAEGERCVRGVCSRSGDCQPICGQVECGADGCGGSCGSCAQGESCRSGRCSSSGPCVRDSDCSGGEVCRQGNCVQDSGCTPQCGGRECGNDGCGGTCGSCNPGATCVGGNCQAQAQCSTDADCAPGQICSAGQCI